MTEDENGRREALKEQAQTSADSSDADTGRAIDKIRDEMATAKANKDAIGAVGEIVTELLEANPAAEAAILAKDKTLEGCFKAMEDYARKHKDGNCYYMPPERAEAVICEYYGIEAGATPPALRATAPCTGEATESGEGKKTVDPFDLDALMGGL